MSSPVQKSQSIIGPAVSIRGAQGGDSSPPSATNEMSFFSSLVYNKRSYV
jgi:hypothetical protein